MEVANRKRTNKLQQERAARNSPERVTGRKKRAIRRLERMRLYSGWVDSTARRGLLFRRTPATFISLSMLLQPRLDLAVGS